MLDDIVEDFIDKGNCIITSSTNNGATSLCLFISNIITERDEIVYFFDPGGSINRQFVKYNYKQTFENVVFIQSSLSNFLNLLQYSDCNINYLFIDPGDILLSNKRNFYYLYDFLSSRNIKLICTSQIRKDISTNKIYSTIERYNKEIRIFKYSIWIRNVSEECILFKRKYIDVFENSRSGNRYVSRYLGNFSNSGRIVG